MVYNINSQQINILNVKTISYKPKVWILLVWNQTIQIWYFLSATNRITKYQNYLQSNVPSIPVRYIIVYVDHIALLNSGHDWHGHTHPLICFTCVFFAVMKHQCGCDCTHLIKACLYLNIKWLVAFPSSVATIEYRRYDRQNILVSCFVCKQYQQTNVKRTIIKQTDERTR